MTNLIDPKEDIMECPKQDKHGGGSGGQANRMTNFEVAQVAV